MKFTLEINLGNDSMQTVMDVSNALNEVSKKLLVNCLDNINDPNPKGNTGFIYDDNGNKVGSWAFKNQECDCGLCDG